MTIYKFMDVVYSELQSDCDNYRANRIIDAADAFAEESILSTINRVLEIIDNDIKDIEAWEEGNEIALPQKNGMLAQARAFREEVLALKEGEQE